MGHLSCVGFYITGSCRSQTYATLSRRRAQSRSPRKEDEGKKLAAINLSAACIEWRRHHPLFQSRATYTASEKYDHWPLTRAHAFINPLKRQKNPGNVMRSARAWCASRKLRDFQIIDYVARRWQRTFLLV